MNTKEKLQLILDKFTSNIKPEDFLFETFKQETSCGTVGCILGWFPELFPKSGFLYEKGVKNFKHKSGVDVITAISRILDLSDKYVRYLFCGDMTNLNHKEHNILNRINLKSSYTEVVDAWRNFISKYDIIFPEKINNFNFTLE